MADEGAFALIRQWGDPVLRERARAVEEADYAPSSIALRTYGIGAQILRDLGVARMRLMALPRKMPSMVGFDLEVTGYMLPAD